MNKIKGIIERTDEYSLIINSADVDSTNILVEEENLDDTEDLHEFLNSDSVTSMFSDWIKNIEEEARILVQNSDEGDRDNLMYNLSFVGFFRRLCKLLPLWSAVCCELFNSPYETSSSANVESDFKNVKLSLKDVIPCRVDVFVDHHLQMLDGAIKIASQRYFQYVDDECSNESISITEIEETLDHQGDQFIQDKSTEGNTELSQDTYCIACKNNHLPSNAHTCYICGMNVHVLPGCSISVGEEEGFGEKRLCITCSASTISSAQPTSLATESAQNTSDNKQKPSRSIVKLGQPTSQATKLTQNASANQQKRSNKQFGKGIVKVKMQELNQKEKWKKKIKRSHYIKPSPHWDLITNVDKKIKLGILRNGSISTTTHRVGKKTVALSNTCAFDSVAQVKLETISIHTAGVYDNVFQILAAAYAYILHYRPYCERSDDAIHEIAILLAKK